MFAELVASLHEQGKSASQHLQELYKRCLPLDIAYRHLLLMQRLRQLRLLPGTRDTPFAPASLLTTQYRLATATSSATTRPRSRRSSPGCATTTAPYVPIPPLSSNPCLRPSSHLPIVPPAGHARPPELPQDHRRPDGHERARPHARVRQREPADVQARAPALLRADGAVPRGVAGGRDEDHAHYPVRTVCLAPRVDRD